MKLAEESEATPMDDKPMEPRLNFASNYDIPDEV